MNILVTRLAQIGKATTSAIFIDGLFECFGLEDIYREIKVPGETRIPAGIYDLRLKLDGKKNDEYKIKFPEFHKGMLEIRGVNNYSGVLIHIGNSPKETEGCLLVGQSSIPQLEQILDSKAAYISFYKKVIKAFNRNEHVYITILDEKEFVNGHHYSNIV